MNHIKKYLSYFPHILLSIFIIVSLVRGFDIASAIATFALSGISGFLLYLDSKKQPDYSAKFKEELESLKQEIHSVKTEVGQLGFSSKRVLHEKVRF